MARPVSTRSAPAQGYLNVTVTEPVTHSDTIGSFVSYKVNTVTDRSDFPYGQVSWAAFDGLLGCALGGKERLL
jgi:hypothetical protein